MMISRAIGIAAFTAAIGLACGVADAQKASGGRPQGAPPEALEACANKSVGDACAMTLPGKGDSVSGQCISTPDQKVACMPEGAPPPPKS